MARVIDVRVVVGESDEKVSAECFSADAGGDGLVRFTLRLPEDLHSRVADLAAKNRRSLNAQVLDLLESGCPDQD